jgi:hypothetical protein
LCHVRVVLHYLHRRFRVELIGHEREDPVETSDCHHKPKPLLKHSVSKYPRRKLKGQVRATCNFGKQARPKAGKSADGVKKRWAPPSTAALTKSILPLPTKRNYRA